MVARRGESSGTVPWDRVVRDLELALTGRLALSARLEERARRYDRPRVVPGGPIRPSVRLDTDLSRTAAGLNAGGPDALQSDGKDA